MISRLRPYPGTGKRGVEARRPIDEVPGKREGAPSRALSIADLALRQENAGGLVQGGGTVTPPTCAFRTTSTQGRDRFS